MRASLERVLVFALMALVLAACGAFTKRAEERAKKPSYYADDGPPDRVPGNLAQIPDAVPRDEPFHRFANRPYTVLGQTYVPVADTKPMKERGLASWYGRKFQGQRTASGEPYDMFAMTAAHRTLPIPSYARVTNVKNGKSVIVRINDRGPFYSKRIIDLSYAAASRISLAQAGSGPVDVERVFPGEVVSEDTIASASAPIAPSAPPGEAAAAVATPVSAPTAIVTRDPGGLWLQLGAFSNRESAESFRDKATRELSWIHEPIDIASADGLHRVRLGPYRNTDEAAAIAEKVRRSLGFDPLLTR
jgi:rare lipoprotein A